MPRYRIITLGCKVNQYESFQVAEVLRAIGYTPAGEGQQADLVVVNTCSVTSQAASKSRNLLRRHARNGARVVAMGCWATSDAKAAKAIVGEDAVAGHADDLLGMFRPGLRAEGRGTLALPLLKGRQDGNQRAIVKVQDGCDAHCTYCIIPKLRDVVWSKPVAEAVQEVTDLVAAGHREVVLTGVFLGAYGQNTALRRRREGAGQLGALVEALCTQVPGLLRLRLSSLEPGDVTVQLVGLLAKHAQVVPHFHLPLQSGSDGILRRMNRQYSAGEYREMVTRLNEAFDRPALTTDVIVGFPGEGEAEFADTMAMAREVGFLHVHGFPYSPRAGTAAARWKEKAVQPRVVTERMRELESLSLELSLRYRRQFEGEKVRVLVERSRGGEVRQGRSERYFEVHFEAAGDLEGKLVEVAIMRATPLRTMGKLTAIVA